MDNERGITLLALVITIIILLILAGITINVITGDNGIIGNAGQAKEETEIANEREIVEKATVQAMGNNKYGNIVEDELQSELDKETGKGKTDATDIGEVFEIAFIDSKRYYIVDKDGNVGEAQDIIEDKSPGDITKDENGNSLKGDESEPYEIWCIEDLVAFSNMVNGEGVIIENSKPIEINTSMTFSNHTVELKRNLNFKSKYSYANSERTDFGDINGDENDGNILINEMTTGTGFNPIGYYTVSKSKSFAGVFDGNNNEIFNLYQSGLFGNVTGNATIKNISVHGVSGMKNSSGIIKEVRGNDVNIINCKNYLDVSVSNRTGGIVGYALCNLNIINCINYGTIEGSSYGVGGLLGYTTNRGGIIKIQNSCSYGKISYMGGGISYSATGGIIGLNQYSDTEIELSNCFSIGDIEGTSVYRANLIGNTNGAEVQVNNSYSITNDLNAINGDYTGDIENKTLEEFRSEMFVNLLNQNIEENTLWNKWNLGENGYPTLK